MREWVCARMRVMPLMIDGIVLSASSRALSFCYFAILQYCYFTVKSAGL